MSKSKARIGFFGRSSATRAVGSERIARERLRGSYGFDMGDMFHARRAASKPVALPSFADNDNFEPGRSLIRGKLKSALRILAGAGFWLAVGYAVHALLSSV